MVIALAGRRIDPPGIDKARFPLENVKLVKERLRQFFNSANPGMLVCSAACGADLLALEEAGKLGIQRKIILPFGPEKFRKISVTDRPGEWGPLFDKVVEEVTRDKGVINLGYSTEDPDAFEKTNLEILNIALNSGEEFYPGHHPVALLVWDEVPKNANDATEHFKLEARKRNLLVKEINSLN